MTTPDPRKGGHLFIIGHDALMAVSDEEVTATVVDLKEFGLFRLPYDRVTVRMLLDDSWLDTNPPDDEMITRASFTRDPKTGRWRSGWFGPAYSVEFRNVNLVGEPVQPFIIHDGSDPTASGAYEKATSIFGAYPHIAELLITLLATRNAIKDTEHNKAARLGIGGKKPGSTRRYEYVTTIGVPTDLEDDDKHATVGKAKAPHLRRGHIRRQHYGPGGQFLKRVWIEPVFVKADREFVATRKAYNLVRPKRENP
jgi:hypothetical protein